MRNPTEGDGFTLIEVLVVMVIIAITVTFAALMFTVFGQQRRITNVAKQLAIVIPVAQLQAQLQPTVLALEIKPQRYQFYQYITTTKIGKHHWQPYQSDVIRSENIPNNIRVVLLPPKIIMLPNGYITPFTINIGAVGAAPSYQIIGTKNGVVTLKKSARGQV